MCVVWSLWVEIGIKAIIEEQWYKKTALDHYVFVHKFSNDDFIILLLYIDYMLIVGKNLVKIVKLNKQLSKFLTMKDLDLAK